MDTQDKTLPQPTDDYGKVIAEPKQTTSFGVKNG